MISAAQIRAGRALLGWSQIQLAEAAGVSVPTVQRAEGAAAIKAAEASIAAIERALKCGGIIFISENGAGSGVRLEK